MAIVCTQVEIDPTKKEGNHGKTKAPKIQKCPLIFFFTLNCIPYFFVPFVPLA